MIQFGSMQDHNVAALLVLPFFCATGFVGNMLVCIAIAIDRRLQNVTNYFLFSLALADLLVCSVVMPLAILVEVQHGVWIWDFWLCLVYTYADVFLCSASIVHISVISLDRYLGISRPLKVRNKSRTVVALKVRVILNAFKDINFTCLFADCFRLGYNSSDLIAAGRSGVFGANQHFIRQLMRHKKPTLYDLRVNISLPNSFHHHDNNIHKDNQTTKQTSKHISTETSGWI